MCSGVFFFVGVLLAQDAPKLPAKAPSAPETRSKPDHSTEALVYEGYVTKVVFENDGTGSREQTVRVRVQSDAGVKQAGVLNFPYESFTSTVDLIYVRVRKPDGSLVATPTENILDMPSEITREAPFYSDLHEKQVAVKGLSQGDVLEYQARWQTTKPLIPNHFWLDYRFAHQGIILDEELEIRFPGHREVKLKSPELKPDISEQNGYKVYHWKSSNLEEKKKEDNVDALWQISTGTLPQPDVRLSTFQTWEEVGRWYGGLQEERVKPSPEVQTKATELTKGLTTEDAKIRALYNFVSTRFRYIGVAFGIGRYQPHSAEDVLGNQYGDCKDKHTLLASLLAASGIKAYPALINGQFEIDSDIPSPSQFNHVITAIPQKDGYLWLDTTPEVAPYGALVPNLRNKHALVVLQNSPPVLMVTPANLPYPTHETFTVEGKLSEEGEFKAKIEVAARSDVELVVRSAFRRTPQPQWKDLVQSASRMRGFGGTVDDLDVSSPDTLSDPFHYSYSYDRKKVAGWEDQHMTVPLPAIITSPYSDDIKTLSSPIFLGSPGDYVHKAKVEIPKGYVLTVPADINLSRSFGAYHVTYLFKDQVLTAERHLTLSARQVPPNQYEEFKSFLKSVNDDTDRFIDLHSIDAGGPKKSETLRQGFESLPETADPEARRLEEESRSDFRNRDIKNGTEKLETALADDPSAVRLQITLGSIYLGTGRQEDGLALLRKAQKSNPELAFPFRSLGMALDRAKKFDEELELWKAYTKRFPDDPQGASNVAGTLYQMKHYSEAATAYEAASRLDGKDAYLPMNMASAYAKSGDLAKALIAYHKAVELDSSSSMLNNVGYEMADNNLNLSEALDYAQKAVRQTGVESTKVEIDNLAVKDLAFTRELGMYWDTLGWVHYRMGDLVQAERYVSASWKLAQDAVIGKHLGEILLKQNKTQAALQVFKESLQAASGKDDDVVVALRAHIKELATTKSPEKWANLQTALNDMRTIKLTRLIPDQASADFFLAISTGGKVGKVKFISGSDKLKSAVPVLSGLKLENPFPDDTPALLVRRGILGCYPVTGCSIVLLTPESVNSVN